MIKFISAIIITLAFFSCTQKEYGPTESLKNYMDYRLSSGQSKSDILELVSGNLHKSVSEMNEEQFKKFTEQKSIKLKQYKVLIKNCNPSDCFITYQISYKQKSTDGDNYRVNVKKIAKLDFIDNKWKVNYIENIKTYIDAKDAIKTN